MLSSRLSEILMEEFLLYSIELIRWKIREKNMIYSNSVHHYLKYRKRIDQMSIQSN